MVAFVIIALFLLLAVILKSSILFIIIMLIPLTIQLYASSCAKFHSSFPNTSFGYRSKLAIKNENTWNIANKYVKISTLKGTIITLIIDIFFWSIDELSVVFVIANILIPLAFAYYTEIHLRKIFNEDGTVRSTSYPPF